jgi:hypothetical protein
VYLNCKGAGIFFITKVTPQNHTIEHFQHDFSEKTHENKLNDEEKEEILNYATIVSNAHNFKILVHKAIS